VHRGVFGNAYSDGSNFHVGSSNWSPDPRATLYSLGGKSKVSADINKHLLKPANVSDNVNWVWKSHNGVANQLTGAVPRYFATAINIDYLCTVDWALRILSAFSSCVGTNVLKQNAGIWPDSLNDLFMNSSLKR
jgi:hypothetical protein